MKTAEEIVHSIITVEVNQYQARQMLKDYAISCAEQALKDAADNATVENAGSLASWVNRDSILSTPILTP